jgi:hypothetical protein
MSLKSVLKRLIKAAPAIIAAAREVEKAVKKPRRKS